MFTAAGPSRTGKCWGVLLVLLCLGLPGLALPDGALASGGGAKKKADSHGAAKSGGSHGASSSGGSHGKEAKPKAKAGGAHGGGHGGSAEGHAKKKEEKPKPDDPTYATELADLLQLIESRNKKHDPQQFSEVALGTYKLSRGQAEGRRILDVSFQLYAIVSDDRTTALEEQMGEKEQRMRDTVLSTLHQATDDELSEPSMPILRRRLVLQLNRVLETVDIRDLAFSEFSTRYQ